MKQPHCPNPPQQGVPCHAYNTMLSRPAHSNPFSMHSACNNSSTPNRTVNRTWGECRLQATHTLAYTSVMQFLLLHAGKRSTSLESWGSRPAAAESLTAALYHISKAYASATHVLLVTRPVYALPNIGVLRTLLQCQHPACCATKRTVTPSMR